MTRSSPERPSSVSTETARRWLAPPTWAKRPDAESLHTKHVGHVQRREGAFELLAPPIAAARCALFLCGVPARCCLQLISPVSTIVQILHM